MLVTMQNSALVSKLVALADGDIDLVQRAIRATSDKGGAADLEKVVQFIVEARKARVKAVA
ncbi:3-deoxy-D-manno-octulosonate 8-phosphate phosphatase KdsC-like HAD superfamily phosphatase [Bradyrhizobium diazoefficiens]